MIKKRQAAPLKLNTETVRLMTEQQLHGVVGGGSTGTRSSCSTGDAYTCDTPTSTLYNTVCRDLTSNDCY